MCNTNNVKVIVWLSGYNSPPCLVSTETKISNHADEKVEIESKLGDARLLSTFVLFIVFDPRIDSFPPYVFLDNCFNSLASCYWTELSIF